MAHQARTWPHSGWRFGSPEPAREEMAAIAADSSLDDRGPSVLLSPIFWIGGLASLAVWTGIWTGIAWLLDRI